MIGREGLAGVPKEQARYIWPVVLPYLETPIRMTPDIWPEDVIEEIVKQKMQLWIIVNETEVFGAMISEIIKSPRAKVLSMPYVGGQDNRIDWPEIYQAMLDYAKSQECDHFRGYGRPGWIRKLQLNTKPLAFFTVGVE